VNKKYTGTYFPKTRLSKLIARPSSISLYAALENAHKAIESMRDEGDKAVMRSIAEIGDIVNTPTSGGEFSEGDLTGVLTRADQIVTLAETFSCVSLATIAKHLCDLIEGFLRTGTYDRAPVLVHVQALIMMAPGGASISDQQFQTMLGELSKVRKHFNIESAVDSDLESLAQAVGPV